MKKELMGMTAPVLTPIRDDGTVNFKEYEKLIKFVLDGGVNHIFVCGSAGEFVSFTLEEKQELLRVAYDCKMDKNKIMFNVTAMNKKDISTLVSFAKEQADMISVTPPYYYKQDETTLFEYFKEIDNMSEGMPIYIYNIPGNTGNMVSPALLKRVSEECKNVVGIKDSSMDFMSFLNYKRMVKREDFQFLIGNDAQVLHSLQAGGDGAVIACAGIYPQLCAGLYQNYSCGNLEFAKKQQDQLLVLREVFRNVMPIMAHKYALELKGFDMGPARFPLRNLTSLEKEQVRKEISSTGLMEI